MSLLDLAISVAVLGIVSAIAIPIYQGYIAEVRVSTAIQDIHQIELILNSQYMDDAPPANLAAAGIDMTDPWGNSYRYLWIRSNPSRRINGQIRQDRNARPINSDYDLYSMGADGQTQRQLNAAKARDDIVRASDGRFVGLAQDY